MRIGTLKLVQVLRAVPGQPLQAVFYLADVLAALRFTSNSNHIPDDARIASWSEFQCLLPELDEKLGRLPGVRKYTKRGTDIHVDVIHRDVVAALIEELRRAGPQDFYANSANGLVELLASLHSRDAGSWFMSTDYSAAITNIYIALADFALKNSNNPGARQIYAPFDATAPIAFELARRGKAVAFEVESAAIHYVVHTLSWAADWPLEARLGSPVLEPSWVEDGSLRVFQGAVCVSPFGRRYDRKVLANDRFERFPEGLFQGELAVVAHAISQSPEFAFIIVPEAVLLRTAGPDRDFKARLLREGRISHIIKMPRGMFHSTGVEASILVLSGRRANDRVRVCDARKYYHPKNREGRKLVGWNPQGLEQLIHDLSSLNEHDEARFVAFDEFESNDFNLGVDRYLKPERQRQIERILAKHRAHPLGDVAEIIRPQLIKRTEDGELELRELSPADLTVTGAFNLPKTPVYFEAGDERRASRQMLRVGDVLLTVRGAVGRVGLVTQELIAEYESASDKRGTYLCPSQAFVILRLRQSGPVVDARVLLRFLVSPLGQQLLSDVTAGTAVPNIPMGDLKALPVLAATETEAREVLRAEFDTQTLHKKIAELRGQIDEIDRKAWPMKLFSEFIETSIDES